MQMAVKRSSAASRRLSLAQNWYPQESDVDCWPSEKGTILRERVLVLSVQDKILETIERTDHLVSLVPADKLKWRLEVPANRPPASDLGHLMGHLLDCMAGFCAAFHAAFPSDLADFLEFRSMPVNQSCSPEEAKASIKLYAGLIERGFGGCTDADLARKIPTVFVPEGETLLTILLGNLEHLLNHKYQLFFHLKLAGLALTSRDIYKWRGAPDQGS
jgi:hypothetical protein